MFHSTERNKQSKCLTCFFFLHTNSSLLSFYRIGWKKKTFFVPECAGVCPSVCAHLPCAHVFLSSLSSYHMILPCFDHKSHSSKILLLGEGRRRARGEWKRVNEDDFGLSGVWVSWNPTVSFIMSQSHSTSLPFPIPISAMRPVKKDLPKEERRNEKNNFCRTREGSNSQQTSYKGSTA